MKSPLPICVPTLGAIAVWMIPAQLTAQSPIVLTDVTSQSGIDFVHSDGSYGQRFMIESMSAGLALIDYDRDGDLDIYFLNGAPIESSVAKPPAAASPATNALYRNDGGFRFTDVTKEAGVGDTTMGLGVACADYDNDGWPDIYVNNYGKNVFYRNNADGTFTDVASQAGVDNGFLVGGGVSFFDMDNDGDLDLYVANYIQFDPNQHRVHFHKGLPSYASPLSYDPQADTLLANNGDGTFRDVSESSGIHAVAGRGMGLVTFDCDADDDIDIFVANDTQENFLWENDGKGHFKEIGLLAGVAYDFRGKPQASMGVALLDVDLDGLQDLYVTSFSEEFATLYRNLGDGLFDDTTLRAGASAATFVHVTWGVVAADFDNDGARDLLIAAGHLDDNRESRGGVSTATAFAVPNVLLRGTVDGTLHDLGSDWGSGAHVVGSTRGLVAGDLDGDGRVDAVATNARAAATVLRNDSAIAPYLVLELTAVSGNRDAIGAVVCVQQDGIVQWQQIHCGHSYQSDSGSSLYFGLPSATQPVRLMIKWPGGTDQTIEGVAPNQDYSVREQPQN